MTTSEENKVNREASKIKKKGSSLPWWVELLFVQIGLPERFLRKILNFQASSTEHFDNHKIKYSIGLIILTSMIYLNPLVRNAKNSNLCVKDISTRITMNEIQPINSQLKPANNALIICNGGNNILRN
ncbi:MULTISPECIES: hypothetical protein [Prochlorococcus]|uniref:Uncharacterized protein n=1 Tax=Prochlorococcus marinus (strain SARG / CCMP1375 / SS120) TaxID=167539 RepID=Q7VC28_PROMA|nr:MULTISPECIES: hypothetical protein [Prochlorococcus]AAP99958.1 Predicted protein [Prochlorococcus marinus subsp. marinus str. CCMP1375]